MNLITEQLKGFRQHNLEDLTRSVLMDRVDTKYIVKRNRLPELLQDLSAHCSVLKVNNSNISAYKTYYYDTPNLKFYLDHHNGKLNRHKVRTRVYTKDSAFLEVKFKNNKSRTIKTRISVEDPYNIASFAQIDFLKRNGIEEPEQLGISQECIYNRIALANESTAERLTIDLDLTFNDPKTSQHKLLDDLVILELKQEKLNRTSILYNLLKNHELKACSFSKYCMGMNLLKTSHLKTNRFKTTFMHLQKTVGEF